VAENDAVDKALRLFVYAPLGIAAYVRDSAPSLLTVFVARGQRELAGVRNAVEQRLGLTEPEPQPSVSKPSSFTMLMDLTPHPSSLALDGDVHACSEPCVVERVLAHNPLTCYQFQTACHRKKTFQ
jgi:hypothetical protein